MAVHRHGSDASAGDSAWANTAAYDAHAWAFGGQVPGPTIEAQVGDVLEIRLINHLPEPTVVHWHGLRIPAAMDGSERVQRPVAPGETFTYRFRVSDAGTIWYHSHYNKTVQMERGLYGALIVRASDEPVIDADRTFVLDDVALENNGEIKAPGAWIESHDGREGSTRLVNGRTEPEIGIAAGQIERWRTVSAASARYVRLSVGGRPFRIIGTGGGLIHSPVSATEVLLTPADRTEITVGPFEEGETIRIETLPFNRGSFKSHRSSERFATVLEPTRLEQLPRSRSSGAPSWWTPTWSGCWRGCSRPGSTPNVRATSRDCGKWRAPCCPRAVGWRGRTTKR